VPVLRYRLPRIKSSAEMRKSMKKSDTVITTIIGKDSVVEGDFRAAGSVRLDGTVEGNVTVSGNLIIGETGKIHGNLEVTSVIIGGEINGNVNASLRTELTSTARLIGDIKTTLIVIDEKAVFQGRCDMNQDDAKMKRRPVRESKAGKRSAKEAIREALKEAEEARIADDEDEILAAASMDSDRMEL